ncbi:DUF115 domain-containing protein [Paenisporosarcina quisquiliarum]|uniref:DUF115 domain-containing protein n=1 Tax=Paenisporosarcina quisquiliarum TaxID=365346 RepID=A0A9X3LFQ5_9BACL|nr:6-hydroxymethylpterin diphosphokinase MptE-like protein [Paenisporosarcina quisquiliarum]MCZ8536937.1 DUF115 domain-containing protein [Paenisporosarcina quisquiliarum]
MTEVEKNAKTGNIIVEQAKTGVQTLKMLIDGKMQYVHSKYDPKKDAQRFVDKFESENIKHVIFVGMGLGYHVENFTKAHPDTKYSIYEPDEQALLTYLSCKSIYDLPINNLVRIFTGTDEEILMRELKSLLQSSNGVLKIITLPVYEKIYSEQIELIMKELVESMKIKKSTLVTNVSFQKRWTINSIKNFPKVLKTPNILHDIDKNAFKDKPAIIVAAGPSLNEEYENLRYIKENGLAYIFSVGSAINSLIEQGIYPDAACTYDPKEYNHLVFEKLKGLNISEVPLIFGSSVGFETLRNYPGEMLHMLTNQDTIAPHYIDKSENINVVLDASSIAVVTFQLLRMLGCSQIVLVGQNLAFQNNSRYAEGINYDFIPNELSEKEKVSLLTVKDVSGQEIQTNESFNRMRQQLERYINLSPNQEVINTTKGGAHIEGTVFMPLTEVISERWTETVNVKPNWFEGENTYNLIYTKKQIDSMLNAMHRLNLEISRALKTLCDINSAVNMNRTKVLEKTFIRFDKDFKKIKSNIFYKAFIEPMVRVYNQRLSEVIQEVRFENDLIKKGRVISEIYVGFLNECQEQMHALQPYVQELHADIKKMI